MGVPCYANVAAVRAALDVAATPQADRDIARAIDDASRAIEGQCNGRRFYPVAETRTMDWPDLAGVNVHSRRLWLDANEAISISTLTVDDVAITDYRLHHKADNGDAYRQIEMNQSGSSNFSGSTNDYQDPISIAGVFGFTNTLGISGTLGVAVATTTETSVTLSDGSRINVGDAIKIDDEYMIVTDVSWVDTTETLAAALDIDSDDPTIAVADGSTYTKGERLLIGTERLEIVDIVANNLIVARAVDASTLSAHSIGAEIYADRGRTVERGALGTTAQTHPSIASTVSYNVPPAAVSSLCIAEAEVLLAQERSGYARTIGSGDAEREARGAGLKEKRDTVRRRYKLKGMVYATGSPLV